MSFRLLQVPAVLILLLGTVVPACAQAVPNTPATPAAVEVLPPPPVAQYPGAILVTEINLSQSDILGKMKDAIAAFGVAAKDAPGEVGVVLKAVNLEDLTAAVQDLKFVRALQFKLPKTATIQQVLGFYTKSTGNESWSKVFWDVSSPGTGFELLSLPGGEGFLAATVFPEDWKNGKPTASRLMIVRTTGSVDIVKISGMFGRICKMAAEDEEKARKESEAKKKPAPKPAAKKPVKK